MVSIRAWVPKISKEQRSRRAFHFRGSSTGIRKAVVVRAESRLGPSTELRAGKQVALQERN